MGADPLAPCILCGGTNFQTRFADGEICESIEVEGHDRGGCRPGYSDCEVISCTQCGLIFRQDSPPNKIEAQLSPPLPVSLQESYGSLQAFHCALERFVSPGIGLEEIEEIGQFRSPPGAFLNVGRDCADILETAKLTGWSSASVAGLSEDSPPMINSHFVGITGSPRYDVVRLEGSLERASDPHAFLRQAGKTLRGNGLLVISTPDCRGWDFPLYGQGASLWPINLPRWFFTPQTLKRLLIKSGFKVLRVSPFKLTYELSTDAFAADVSTRLLVQQSRHFRIFARRQQKRISDPLRQWERESLPAEQPTMLEPA